MLVNRLRRLSKIKFATWVANGQLACGDAPPSGSNCSMDEQKRTAAKQKRRHGWSQAALQS
jgi:hypothetical protein